MRNYWLGACLLLVGAQLEPAANKAHAQGNAYAYESRPIDQRPYIARAQNWGTSGYESIQTPLPLGQDRPESGGVYFGAEFLFMNTRREIGNQLIATRGFRDSDGSITGNSGTYIGSGDRALDTDSWGRTTWTPGFRATAGWLFANGISVSVSYAHLFDAKYTAGAGPIPENFDTNAAEGGADALLFSPVFNFSPQFSGPPSRFTETISQITGFPIQNSAGSGGSPYGIWNGANTMDIQYTQRFDNWDITARIPVFDTDYSRSYALAGGRFSWIWERFGWRTVASNFRGQSLPEDTAEYSNIISQRMYGPFLGCGNEIYLGSAFSFSVDMTGSVLYSVVKERAKYVRGDESTQAKRSVLEYTIVPNGNVGANLWWFPIQGVQLRAGYELWSYFNTIYMDQPVGFNHGAIDPAYNRKLVRIYHGFHVGVAINF